MTINAGVWIDHHKAVVVLFTEKGEDLRQILADGHNSGSGNGAPGEGSHARKDFVAEDKRERKTMIYLNHYYDEVLHCIQDADSILVLGPGEAKGELKKRAASQKLRGQITELETADKLTDGQIAKHVREHFSLT